MKRLLAICIALFALTATAQEVPDIPVYTLSDLGLNHLYTDDGIDHPNARIVATEFRGSLPTPDPKSQEPRLLVMYTAYHDSTALEQGYRPIATFEMDVQGLDFLDIVDQAVIDSLSAKALDKLGTVITANGWTTQQ